MLNNKPPDTSQDNNASPTIVPPNPQILNRIDIQGVSVGNFLETSKTIEETGEVFAVENEDYAIIYHKNDKSFLINILSSPFDLSRQKAEGAFLQTLGIDNTSACKLNVVVQTPFFANPDNAGIPYPLSFCR